MKTSDQDECVLCCSDISIYAIGICDHPVCYECSARMRVLCETNECPICRSNMDMVIWTYEKQPFTDINRKFSLMDRKFQITFEDADAQRSFNRLLEYRCNDCDEVFQTFNKLKDHIRRQHDLHFCELCSENLKIFPSERKIYNRKDLARHKRVGDPDNTSHRGHPLCEFCDQRYVDTDDLFRHLRREHYFCHFCDADGKHQYYEDYDYLKVHFRKEHYLCEEGDCANEQFIGAFRSEIDLKAHIAVLHSKNKSKAEARQARMLELEFPIRPSGNSSPRGGRRYQQKRHEENSRERNSARETSQQAEQEMINTTCTLEFPSLSEDSESRSSHSVPAPTSNFNSVTVQSIGGRNYRPPPQRNTDFPALVSAETNVSSNVSNNHSQKLSITVNTKNNPPVRTSMSVHLSQKHAQVIKSEQDSEDKNIKQEPTWISKKKNRNFEEEFPKLETKKVPVSYNSFVNVSVSNPVQRSAAISSSAVPVSTHVANGDQFVVIKSKSKKKKQNKATGNNIRSNDFDDDWEEDELANKPNVFLVNNSKLINPENKDRFKQNLVRSEDNSRTKYNQEDTWHQTASFGKDDFPPLAPSEVTRKPPGLVAQRTRVPPPGFNSSSNVSGTSKPLNISLSSIARQLVIKDKNETNAQIPHSDFSYKKPPNFEIRNQILLEKIQNSSAFDEFKKLSGNFRNNIITASDYYTKCLDIMGKNSFYEIFPDLISLLPDINKQQQLLEVHKKYQNSSGAVPKTGQIKTNQLSVCDICYQVILENDQLSHKHD